jgi:hypothetical protein
MRRKSSRKSKRGREDLVCFDDLTRHREAAASALDPGLVEIQPSKPSTVQAATEERKPKPDD